MQDSASFEIKALLTLTLLKSGTSAKEIQTAVKVAAAARLMVVEEYSALIRGEEIGQDANVTSIYELRNGAGAADNRKRGLPIENMNSDIKALLSLLLLQHGATPREILTTLRMAAAARVADDEEMSSEQNFDDNARPEKPQPTPKQAIRNDFLAPVPKVARAA
jgi:hypothetical protein